MKHGIGLLIGGALLLAGWLAAGADAAAPLATVKANGIIEVKTDRYSLAFFPGCMFPFDLKLADGAPVPEIVFLDRLVDAGKKQYYLRFDRFAEAKILRNDADVFSIEISGSYCLSEDAGAPGRPRAVYRYECRRGDPAIRVAGTVSRTDDAEWGELYFMQPGWRGNPFAALVDQTGRSAAFRAAETTEPAMFAPAGYAGLSDGAVEIGLVAPKPMAWNNSKNRYFTYLCAAKKTRWKEKTAEFEAAIVLKPAAKAAPEPEAAVKPDAGWPASIAVELGNLAVRLERRSCWTLYRVDFEGANLGVDRYGSHYGNVFSFRDYGFVGSGHTENENEQLLEIRLEIDGRAVTTPAAQYRAKQLRLTKKSLVRRLEVDTVLEITDGRIHEEVRVCARGAESLNFAYFGMYPWSTDFSRLVSIDPASETVLDFTDSKGFLLKTPAKAAAVYSDKLGKGIVTFITAEENLGRREELYWDYPERYRKHYSRVLIGRALKPGDRAAMAITSIPFAADPAGWIGRARALYQTR